MIEAEEGKLFFEKKLSFKNLDDDKSNTNFIGYKLWKKVVVKRKQFIEIRCVKFLVNFISVVNLEELYEKS